jgi:hypothetical protein
MIIALFLLCLAIGAALVAVWPDRRIVFDAEAKTVRIFRQYLWSATESLEEVPFSAVLSIGGDVTSSDDDTRYVAVLRLNWGRNVILWDLARPAGGNPRPESIFKSDDKLIQLLQLTGLRREDRFN